MATTSISKSTLEEKGKMILTKPNVTLIADLKPMDTNKTIEAVVYRKWTSKHVQTQQPMKYCCILLDKQGTPIQANIDVKDIAYFDRLLQLHKAYRISRFSCEQTGLWERTLDNPTSLIFGRFIQLEEVPGEDFPEQYFNFASYNELAARADVKNAILTDYIGHIQAVSRIHTSGDATSNRIHRRIIDIQNLSGNTISLALWHDMAVNFNLQEYEALEMPIVIAVSSSIQVPKPIAAPISEHQSEAIQDAKPLSPASSTPASNQPEVVAPETAATKEPQSTPPTIPETVKPIKGDQQTNLPNTSARKSLFKTEPEADTSKRTKKVKQSFKQRGWAVHFIDLTSLYLRLKRGAGRAVKAHLVDNERAASTYSYQNEKQQAELELKKRASIRERKADSSFEIDVLLEEWPTTAGTSVNRSESGCVPPATHVAPRGDEAGPSNQPP
nr:hypothetical protein [Tanacetum cinerariifolium]